MKAEIYFLESQFEENLGEISPSDILNIDKAFKDGKFHNMDQDELEYKGFSFQNDGDVTRIQFLIQD
jgi:hypothetical protein